MLYEHSMQRLTCLNVVRFLEELIKKVNFDLTRITCSVGIQMMAPYH